MNEGLPKAYREGRAEFFGREFAVTPDVLIPRPETETAVEMVMSLAGKPYLSGLKVGESKLPKNARILDVGTGSGVIAVTLKLELPEAEVVAVDISEEALKVAEENARRLGAEVEFVQSDLLESVSGNFDVIVANLPYVDRDWEWLDSSLRFEPEEALYAKDEGLEIIFRLLEQVKDRTKYLILEADPVQHGRIMEKCKVVRVNGYQLLAVFGESNG